MTALTQAALFSYLRAHCRDEANVTPLPAIARDLGTNTRAIQALLEECDGISGPDVVVSRTAKPAGLFITADPVQMAGMVQQLANRERHIRNRRLTIERRHPQLRATRLGRPPAYIQPRGAVLRAQEELAL